MLDLLVVQDLAVKRTDKLVDANVNAAVGGSGYFQRLDARIDLGPLARPVIANCVPAMDPT